MSEPTSWPALAAALLLWLTAGVCIYLFLLNRYLLLLTDGLKKTLVLRGSMFAIGIAALLIGWWAAGRTWLAFAAPIGVLAVFAIGEARRIILRRRCLGAPPVESENAGVRLRSPITTTDLAVHRYELAVPHWHGRRLRVAHVSDLHLNGDLPAAYYARVMARVARAEPDLLIFTGDLVTKVKYAMDLPAVLTLARGKLATLAILGNHDYWVGPQPVAAAVEAAGVTLLTDRCIRLAVDGHSLTICGYEGPWSKGAWLPPQIAPGEFALLLTHTPDNIYRLRGLGFAAIFAGHYHAGQVRLPWLGPIIVPSRYGRRFDHGHFVVDGAHLFITAGVGSAVPPRRIYCQPDIFIVDFVASADGGSRQLVGGAHAESRRGVTPRQAQRMRCVSILGHARHPERNGASFAKCSRRMRLGGDRCACFDYAPRTSAGLRSACSATVCPQREPHPRRT